MNLYFILHYIFFKVIQQKILPRQELSKFVFRSKRKLFRKISKQNSKMIILKIFMLLIKILQSLKNSIKYIMFQAYSLCFCIFGTISSKFLNNSKKYIEKTHATDKKYEPKDEKKKIMTEPKKENTKKENSKNKNKSASSHNKNHKGKKNNDTDKIITTKENFDSSTELWNVDTNDIMIMNMTIENEDINRSIESCKIAEEPVEISVEHIVNNMNSKVITSQENELFTSAINNDFQTQFSKSFIDEKDSISSVDEEIAQVFQNQYNSSEDEFKSSSFHTCCATCKCERSKQNNFYCHKVINNYSHNSSFISESKNEERMKKTECINGKRKKIISHENGKYAKYRNDKNTKKEKNESPKNVSPIDKSRFSRMPIKINKLEYNNIKYKEMATQTDNSFLINDDVEMISINTNGFSEQQFYCKSQFNHFQVYLQSFYSIHIIQ